jgi:glutamate/tyrosine decarboxylase-like PLP-dependent enzyme
VHVDGAFGLWAAASPGTADQVAGIAAADSWATDAHKWLNTTYDCGIALVADPRALRSAMEAAAAYRPEDATLEAHACRAAAVLAGQGAEAWRCSPPSAATAWHLDFRTRRQQSYCCQVPPGGRERPHKG